MQHLLLLLFQDTEIEFDGITLLCDLCFGFPFSVLFTLVALPLYICSSSAYCFALDLLEYKVFDSTCYVVRAIHTSASWID